MIGQHFSSGVGMNRADDFFSRAMEPGLHPLNKAIFLGKAAVTAVKAAKKSPGDEKVKKALNTTDNACRELSDMGEFIQLAFVREVRAELLTAIKKQVPAAGEYILAAQARDSAIATGELDSKQKDSALFHKAHDYYYAGASFERASLYEDAANAFEEAARTFVTCCSYDLASRMYYATASAYDNLGDPENAQKAREHAQRLDTEDAIQTYVESPLTRLVINNKARDRLRPQIGLED